MPWSWSWGASRPALPGLGLAIFKSWPWSWNGVMIFELCLITYGLDQTVCWRSQCLLSNVQRVDILVATLYSLHSAFTYLLFLDVFTRGNSTSAKLWEQVTSSEQFQSLHVLFQKIFSTTQNDFSAAVVFWWDDIVLAWVISYWASWFSLHAISMLNLIEL